MKKRKYRNCKMGTQGSIVNKFICLSDFSGIPDSVWIRLNGSGRVRGAATNLLVSEPRFRRFYKTILKLFVNNFEFFF